MFLIQGLANVSVGLMINHALHHLCSVETYANVYVLKEGAAQNCRYSALLSVVVFAVYGKNVNPLKFLIRTPVNVLALRS